VFHPLRLCPQISMLTYLSSYLAMASAFYYVIFEGVAAILQQPESACGSSEVSLHVYHVGVPRDTET